MFNFKFDFNFILTKVKELVKSKFFWINIGAAVLAKADGYAEAERATTVPFAQAQAVAVGG